MRKTTRRTFVRAAALAAFALSWVFFAPVQVGGSAVYTVTVGNSMEPRFHAGDLAILRRASSYGVGDIVLYQSGVLHRPVLHRILVVQNGEYFFKGDHNDFVDPGSATSDELLGKLWVGVPHAGGVLGWLGVPLHASLLAGLACAFLLLGGGSRSARRRPKGRRTPAPAARAPVTRPPRPNRRFLHRPRKTAANFVAGAGFVLAAVCLTVGYSAPLSRVVSVTGYQQTGSFSYAATLARPNTAYPTGVVRTGQPLFLGEVDKVNVGFDYRFASRLAHGVHGTISLKALIRSDTGWHNLYTMKKAAPFRGDAGHVGGVVSLNDLTQLLDQVSRQSGALGAEYSIDLLPTVHVIGLVNGERIDTTFAPVLPFTVNESVLKLDVAPPVALPGASYEAPSSDEVLSSALQPIEPGKIPGIAPNYVRLARYDLAVSAVRGIGLGLAGLALLAFLSKLFKPAREVWSDERRIAFRYECTVIDVVSFAAGSRGGQPIEVPDFESLARLAQYCERPILRESRGERPAFAVEDEGRFYVYRPHAQPSVSRLVKAGAEAEAS